MYIIIVFSLLCLFLIDVIAVGVFLNFYLETKRKALRLSIFGWISYALGQLTPLFAESAFNLIISEFLYLSYGFLTSIGFFLIGLSMIDYFIEIRRMYILIAVSFFISLPIIIWLTLDLKIALNISLTSFELALFCSFISPAVKRKQFKQILGKSIPIYFLAQAIVSIYIPISIITILMGHAFGLFFSDDLLLISMNYWNILAGTIIVMLFFVHLEVSTSNQKRFELKDSYSHNMGNILQTIYLEIELLKIKKELTFDKQLNLAIEIEEKIDKATNFLNEIKKIK